MSVEHIPRGGRRRASAWVLVVMIIAGVYVAAFGGKPTLDGDSPGYLRVAQDLSDLSLEQAHFRPPGYPAFLAITGSVPVPGTMLLTVQVLLHAAAVALLVALLRRSGVPPGHRFAFAVVAFLPPFVEHAAYVMSETLTQLLVVLGFVALVSWLASGRRTALAVTALAFGPIGLVHPAYQGMGVFLAVTACVWTWRMRPGDEQGRRSVAAGVAVTLATMAFIGSFVLYNQRHFGYTGVTPMLGFTLSHKTVRLLERLPPEYDDVKSILIRYRNEALTEPTGDHLAYAYVFSARPELEAATGLSSMALSDRLVAANLRLIRTAPMEYLDEVGRSLVWYWAPGVSDVGGLHRPWLKVLGNLLRVLVLFGFLAVMLVTTGSFVFYRWMRRMVSRNGRLPGAPGGEAEVTRMAMPLFLSLAAIGFSMVVCTALTSAVFRLRVPVDLLILSSIPLGLQLLAKIGQRLRYVPPAAESVHRTDRGRA